MSTTTPTLAATTAWVVWREDDMFTIHRTEEGARREASEWADYIERSTGWRPSPVVYRTEVQD